MKLRDAIRGRVEKVEIVRMVTLIKISGTDMMLIAAAIMWVPSS